MQSVTNISGIPFCFMMVGALNILIPYDHNFYPNNEMTYILKYLTLNFNFQNQFRPKDIPIDNY